MIQRDMLCKPAFEYIKKERFTGSINGMRYLYETTQKDDIKYITARHWPEPFCFEKTDETKIVSKDFEHSTDGLNKAIDWLDGQQEEIYGENKG